MFPRVIARCESSQKLQVVFSYDLSAACFRYDCGCRVIGIESSSEDFA